MELKRFLAGALMAVFLSSVFVSCDDSGSDGKVGVGTVSGKVTDTYGTALAGVTVSSSNTEATVETSSDGSYLLPDVQMKRGYVTFAKKGYQTTSITVSSDRYDSEGNVVVNAWLNVADAKIKGIVRDGQNGDALFKGVTVKLGEKTVTTDAKGAYLFEDLTVMDYTLTFSADGYVSVSSTVTADMFNNAENTAELDITLYKSQLLPGRTLADLQKADKWFYNEYRGGGNGQEYPRWDWSTCFMASLDFQGQWAEIGEGTDIRVEETSKEPVSEKQFHSYVLGSKLITEDNYIMTVRYRTFADRDGATIWGLQVVDLSEAEPAAVQIGDLISSSNTDYKDQHFDLSAYKGKEVVLALGVFKTEEKAQKHLAVRRINFTSEPMTGWNWISGTDVPGLEGWHMTEEMVRSTMVQTEKTFSGLTLGSDNRQNQYQSWRQNNHIGWLWGFTVITKDTEIFVNEGSIIKTRGGNGVVNTKVPESYFYTKFPIGEGSNKLTFKIRNFSGNATFFKVTAITEDFQVEHLSPVDYNAVSASAAADGCWKFINNKGDRSNPDDYATFTYDLSEYNGKNVIVTIGVFKGENNGDESKICFYSVTMN